MYKLIIKIIFISYSLYSFPNDRYVGIIFEDMDGSEYVSHSLSSWNLVNGSGDWSVFKDTEREIRPFVLVDEYGNNQAMVVQPKDELNYKKTRLAQRDAIQSLYNLVLNRESNQEALIVEYTQLFEHAISFQIVDINGIVVYETESINFSAGTNNYFIDISKLNKGVYFLRTSGGQVSMSVKFLKET